MLIIIAGGGLSKALRRSVHPDLSCSRFPHNTDDSCDRFPGDFSSLHHSFSLLCPTNSFMCLFFYVFLCVGVSSFSCLGGAALTNPIYPQGSLKHDSEPFWGRLSTWNTKISILIFIKTLNLIPQSHSRAQDVLHGMIFIAHYAIHCNKLCT